MLRHHSARCRLVRRRHRTDQDANLADAHGKRGAARLIGLQFSLLITRHNSPFAEFLMMAPKADQGGADVHPQLLGEPVPVDFRIKLSALIDRAWRRSHPTSCLLSSLSRTPDPLFGVFLHWLGGLVLVASKVPFRKILASSREIFLVGGRIVQLGAGALADRVFPHATIGWCAVRSAQSVMFWCVLLRLVVGFRGLTFGLTLRYLGLSLGKAIIMGLTATFCTLMPPLFLANCYPP